MKRKHSCSGLTRRSDLNCYHAFALSLKQKPIVPYFAALKELGHIFIIDGAEAKAIGQLVADMSRYGGVFRVEDIYEFVQRRADWLKVKKEVERVMFGLGYDCVLM